MGIKRRVAQWVQFFIIIIAKKQHKERKDEMKKTNLGWVSNGLKAKSPQIWMNLSGEAEKDSFSWKV